MPDQSQRLQRSRQKGSKLPPGTVCVTRPSRWGNPYRVGDAMTPDRAYPAHEDMRVPDGWRRFSEWLGHGDLPEMTAVDAVRFFRVHVRRKMLADPSWLEPLRGKDLACWCKVGALWCHGDVLIELSNRPTP